jgi:hypothetical protein
VLGERRQSEKLPTMMRKEDYEKDESEAHL